MDIDMSWNETSYMIIKSIVYKRVNKRYFILFYSK